MTAPTGRAQGSEHEPPRVVFDTHVVVSALVFGHGTAAKLRAAWQRGDCVPLASTATAQELIRVLAYPKFRLDAAAQQELLADYLPYALVIRIPEPLPAVPACRDVFDLPFLHLAAAGRSDALVTGDRDLLALPGQVGFPILQPDAFFTPCHRRLRPHDEHPRDRRQALEPVQHFERRRVIDEPDRCADSRAA